MGYHSEWANTARRRYGRAQSIPEFRCAWLGHFFFEHNKPATFQYPLWSFMGDWVMLKHFLSGELRDIHPALSNESFPSPNNDE